jgi:hypothetical protein
MRTLYAKVQRRNMRRSPGPLQGTRNGEKGTVGRKGTSLERIWVGRDNASFLLRGIRGSAAMVNILEVSKQQQRKNGVINDGSRNNLYKGGVNDGLQNYTRHRQQFYARTYLMKSPTS